MPRYFYYFLYIYYLVFEENNNFRYHRYVKNIHTDVSKYMFDSLVT